MIYYTKEEIKNFAKEYLSSKDIDIEEKHKKDECDTYIVGKYGLYYIETRVHRFTGMIYPGEDGYPAQAEGNPCPTYSREECHRFVCDLTGNIILDVTPVQHFFSTYENLVFLDEENILVPTLVRKNSWPNSNNDIQHIRVRKGKGILIHTFDGMTGIPRVDDKLLKNKLVNFDGQLYDFGMGRMIGHKFDKVISDDKYDLISLAKDWGIPYGNYNEPREQFAEQMQQKMRDQNLFGGIKTVKAQRGDALCSYTTLALFDRDGRIASELYYMDNEEIVSVPVNDQSYDQTINALNEIVIEEAEKKSTEKTDGTEKIPKVIQKLFPTEN